MENYIQDELRQIGFVTSQQSMMTRSLKRYCNQEIKKIDDSSQVNDQRNTVETFVRK